MLKKTLLWLILSTLVWLPLISTADEIDDLYYDFISNNAWAVSESNARVFPKSDWGLIDNQWIIFYSDSEIQDSITSYESMASDYTYYKNNTSVWGLSNDAYTSYVQEFTSTCQDAWQTILPQEYAWLGLNNIIYVCYDSDNVVLSQSYIMSVIDANINSYTAQAWYYETALNNSSSLVSFASVYNSLVWGWGSEGWGWSSLDTALSGVMGTVWTISWNFVSSILGVLPTVILYGAWVVAILALYGYIWRRIFRVFSSEWETTPSSRYEEYLSKRNKYQNYEDLRKWASKEASRDYSYNDYVESRWLDRDDPNSERGYKQYLDHIARKKYFDVLWDSHDYELDYDTWKKYLANKTRRYKNRRKKGFVKSHSI